jgi:hypothetical protein
MPIRACPSCSSDRLVFPNGGTLEFTCEDCGWRGTPDEFANWAAWQGSRQAKRAVVTL